MTLASADRRPVDPPPIVKLNIYQGESWEVAKDNDITFEYNTEFFLYASLENSRPMAHGRVQTAVAPSPPVLTGTPVSGSSYLDRPSSAVYFLFPDLSVRHEGFYRLVFLLYESNKQPMDGIPGPQDNPEVLEEGGDFFTFLMETRSKEFQVYSAKKFPGLSTSTALSRCVADQGCRVRIRRDVRMRKRKGGKGGDDDDDAPDDYALPQRAASPNGYHARSSSRSSMDPTSARRMSGIDYHPPPPPLLAAQPAGSHLGFGNRGYAPHGLSEPVSPRDSAFRQGHGLPIPSASQSLTHDDRRQSLIYPSSSANMLPPIEARQSKVSLPARLSVSSVDTPRSLKSDYSSEDSPKYSPSSSISSTYPLPQRGPTKRTAGERDTDRGEYLSYSRADGKHVSRWSQIYGHERRGSYEIDPALEARPTSAEEYGDYVDDVYRPPKRPFRGGR